MAYLKINTILKKKLQKNVINQLIAIWIIRPLLDKFHPQKGGLFFSMLSSPTHLGKLPQTR